jgi:hypothetical protein
VPYTARKHFDEDIAAAWALHGQATSVEDVEVATEIARASIVFGVGALDAYLCDAFVDLLARTLKHCRNTKTAAPAGYAKLAMPVGPLIGTYESRENWGLRMSARAFMAKDNMLQLGRVKDLLNPGLGAGRKLWDDLIEDYIALNRKRLTGIRSWEYGALAGKPKQDARKNAAKCLLRHMGEIVQRRHDIVHNCDRPKSAKQKLTLPAADKILTDIQSFVSLLDSHIDNHRMYE